MLAEPQRRPAHASRHATARLPHPADSPMVDVHPEAWEDPMARLVISEFLTLDGVMQAPGDPDEDRRGGFEHGGWQLQFFDEAFGDFVMGAMTSSGAYLFGRRTYQTFAGFWPNQPADDPVAGPMNATPKYVVSTSLTE